VRRANALSALLGEMPAIRHGPCLEDLHRPELPITTLLTSYLYIFKPQIAITSGLSSQHTQIKQNVLSGLIRPFIYFGVVPRKSDDWMYDVDYFT